MTERRPLAELYLDLDQSDVTGSSSRGNRAGDQAHDLHALSGRWLGVERTQRRTNLQQGVDEHRHQIAGSANTFSRNLLVDLEDTGHVAQIKFLIRDRDAKYLALIDEVRRSAGITTVPSGTWMPRMNSIIERWVTIERLTVDRQIDGPPRVKPTAASCR